MKYLFVLVIAVVGVHCSPRLSPDAGWGPPALGIGRNERSACAAKRRKE